GRGAAPASGPRDPQGPGVQLMTCPKCQNRPGLGRCVCQQAARIGSLTVHAEQLRPSLADRDTYAARVRKIETLAQRARRRIKELRQEADRLQAALDLLEGLPNDEPEGPEDGSK